MTLDEWIKQTGTAVVTIAEKVGVSRATVYFWLANKRLPSRKHARQLEELTQGAVQLRDWPDEAQREA